MDGGGQLATIEVMSATMKTISFAIPVYRNERAVSLTYQKIKDLFSGTLHGYAYELVFVDDGSDDNSLAELLEIRDQDHNVKVISFTRNFGQMAAILAALAAATGDVIIQMSADLQDPVELIPTMVGEWEQSAEIVVCHRADRDDTLTAKIASALLYRIVRASIPQIPKGGFDYILLDRRVVDAFNKIDVRNRFFQGDILWFGFRTKFIPYKRQRRTIGKSQYTFAKKLKNALDAVLDSSYLPIRFIAVFGVCVGFGGCLYALDVVYAKLVNQVPFTGWAPLMIVVLLTSGSMMFMLAIIGEYIWRIYDEIRKKPNYVIRDAHL